MRNRTLAALVGLMSIVAVTGFTGAGAGPRTLEAQWGCGRFTGNLCQADCTRECSSGGCCSWSFYYYATQIIE